MEHTSHEFLRQLLETASPSGFEQSIQQVVRNHAKTFADEVRTDSHGNVFAVRHPEGQSADAPRIMLAPRSVAPGHPSHATAASTFSRLAAGTCRYFWGNVSQSGRRMGR